MHTATPHYDVVIAGAGVTGSAVFWVLRRFTGVRSALLVERRGAAGQVASAARNNSQTVHCGDIETNYGPAKALAVRDASALLKNYLSAGARGGARMGKMTLGVGAAECALLETRLGTMRPLFPALRLLTKQQLLEVEPAVVQTAAGLREGPVNALHVADDLSAVNYETMCGSFLAGEPDGRRFDVSMNTSLMDIRETVGEPPGGPRFVVHLGGKGVGQVRADSVLVAACGYSLRLAQQLGYGLDLSVLPVAGSFYVAKRCLRGKVYTVQDPALPFAAVHGDPELTDPELTRFGPTALPIPLLERDRWGSAWALLRTLRPDVDLLRTYAALLRDREQRAYVLRNLRFELPGHRRLFARDAQKVVPSLTWRDLRKARGWGGVRPQVIDKKTHALKLGEARIASGHGLVFCVTPSPGGTTCLANAEREAKEICQRLGVHFDQKKFDEELRSGPFETGS